MTDCGANVLAINSAACPERRRRRRDEYGIPGSTNQGRFQYTGQAWLAELGMYHYKARLYSPSLGRFLQTDPIGYADGMNMYAYVGNDPVNFTDPLGLSQEDGIVNRLLTNLDGGSTGPDIIVTASRLIGIAFRDIGVISPGGPVPEAGVGEFPGGEEPSGPDITVTGRKPKKLSRCMKAFLGSRGIPTANLQNVVFLSTMNANPITRRARRAGASAITRGNTIYVNPLKWDQVTNPLAGVTFFEEVVHSVQYHESGNLGFDIWYLLGGAMSWLGGIERGYPNHIEIQANLLARRLFQDYSSLLPNQRC